MNISTEAKKRAAAFKPTRDMVTAAEAVFQCMAFVETIRPIVKGYQQKILDYEKYAYDKQWIERGEKTWGDWIDNPDHTYLMGDDDFQHYLKRCNEEREKAGLKVERPEYCPLLVAEELLRKARRVLVEVMEPITHIRADDLWNPKDRDRLVELTLRLLAPYVKGRI